VCFVGVANQLVTDPQTLSHHKMYKKHQDYEFSGEKQLLNSFEKNPKLFN
jgi:hypothetical protein